MGFSNETGVHLGVDTSFTHLDLEGTLITPGVVPGVNAEPVVDTIFVTPTDGLDGVATESRTRLVSVDTALIGKEVLIDGESSSDGTMLVDIRLDGIDTSETIRRGSEVLVASVIDGGVGLAGALALGFDLNDVIAATKAGSGDVVSALGHGVVEAEFIITKVTTGNNTSRVKPGPGSSNLTTVATHREAMEEVAAASGIRNGEEVVDTLGDARSIVKSLGGTVSPA